MVPGFGIFKVLFEFWLKCLVLGLEYGFLDKKQYRGHRAL